MVAELIFRKIWYRNKVRNISMKAMDDVGTLALNNGTLEFIGKKNHLIMSHIQNIQFGKLLPDLANNWITVEYLLDSTLREACFANGGALGWSGIVGGTKRIFDEIQIKLSEQNSRSIEPVRNIEQTTNTFGRNEPQLASHDFALILHSTFMIHFPSYVEPDTTAQVQVIIHNRSNIELRDVSIDLTYLENYFSIEGGIEIALVAPWMEIENYLRIKPKSPKGTFPIKVRIVANGMFVEQMYTIKVGGTEVY